MAAAAVLGVVLLVAFVLSRRPSATDSVSSQQTTAGPVSEVTSGSAEVVDPFEEPDKTRRREISDAELYHQANVAFEQGELDSSKNALENLLRRNPSFEGAPELLVEVNQALRHDEGSTLEGPAPAPEPAPVAPAGEAQLLYQATLAFERGDLEASKQQLEALLQTNPSLEGASELLVKVHDEIWKKRLPMSFRVEHNHRIGSCSGTLTFAAWGIRYTSEDHEWRWGFDEIRTLERDGRWILNLESHETDALSLGKPKNYKFEFRSPMRDEDWSRYRRLAR